MAPDLDPPGPALTEEGQPADWLSYLSIQVRAARDAGDLEAEQRLTDKFNEEYFRQVGASKRRLDEVTNKMLDQASDFTKAISVGVLGLGVLTPLYGLLTSGQAQRASGISPAVSMPGAFFLSLCFIGISAMIQRWRR